MIKIKRDVKRVSLRLAFSSDIATDAMPNIRVLSFHTMLNKGIYTFYFNILFKNLYIIR